MKINKLIESCFDNINKKGIYVVGTNNCSEEFIAMYQHDYLINGIYSIDNQKQRIENYVSKDINAFINDPSIKVIICDERYDTIIKLLEKKGCNNYGIFSNCFLYPGRQKYIPGTCGINDKQTFYITKENDRKNNGKYHIGYIAGVFDLYHIGHLNLIKRAKEMCDYLIVGVVSDRGVTEYKNKDLIIPFEERIEIVRSCKYVDEAVEIPFKFCHSTEAFRKYHFDVQFSGSDYENNKSWLSVRDFLRDNGSDLIFLPYTFERSTSKIKESIKKR